MTPSRELVDFRSVAVIGAGSWGTALASLLATKLASVTLWCLEVEVAAGINQNRHNPLYVAEWALADNIKATTDLEQAAGHGLLVVVVPTQFTRQILLSLRPYISAETRFVSAAKGVEVGTLTLLSEVYAEIFGDLADQRTCFLSGPSFARDVMQRQPTAVAVAGRNPYLVESIQQLFSTPFFRTYRTDDVIGLELGGALKNIMALASGMSDGLNFGNSARAALITRGLSEMRRLGVRLGAHAETFSGLSGLGDLLLTATSAMSRNRTVGFRLGQGETLDAIQKGTREVAEGIRTTESVYHLARKVGVDMPITQGVYDILYKNRSPHSVVSELMNRDLKAESE